MNPEELRKKTSIESEKLHRSKNKHFVPMKMREKNTRKIAES